MHPVKFSEIFNLFEIYVPGNFFIFGFIEIGLFFLLSIYFFYTAKLEIGIASHPLFFLGYTNFKKKVKTHIGSILKESLIQNNSLIETEQSESTDLVEQVD